MPAPSASRQRFRLGFHVFHQTLWFSELLAITAIGLFLFFFIAISVVIFTNFLTIKEIDKKIASLKAEQIELDNTLVRMRKEARLVMLLQAFAGKGVSSHTLCRVAEIVSSSSDQFGYDPLLVLAVIRVESFFSPDALGRYKSGELSGAFGLMQLKYQTAVEVARQLEMPELTKNDLFNPEINLVLGVAYLIRLIANFKSFKLGLLAYNQGPGTILETLSNREPLSIGYYQKVLKHYYALKKLAAEMESDGSFKRVGEVKENNPMKNF